MQRSAYLIIILYILLPHVIHAQHTIGQATREWTDPARSRKLITEIWYPTAASSENAAVSLPIYELPPTVREATPLSGKHPLVVLSHGTGGDRFGLAWLGTALAAEGYLVAAVNHWGNTWDNKIMECFAKSWERPLDLSFVITQLLADDTWHPYIDEHHMAAIGFSIGGYTVIAMGGAKMDYDRLQKFTTSPAGGEETNIPEMPGLQQYLQTHDFRDEYARVKDALYDPRIQCVVAMSPAIGQGFSPESLKRVSTPMLIIGAAADQIAPIATNAGYYADHLRKVQSKILPAPAGHYVFLNTCSTIGKDNLPTYVCQDPTGIDRNQLHQEVIQTIKQYLQNTLHLTK